MARDIIYNALIKKYEADIADANTKITLLLTGGRIIPEHIDITGEVDKLLGKIEEAESRMAILQRVYGRNQATVDYIVNIFINFLKNKKIYFDVKCPMCKKINKYVNIWGRGGHFRGENRHFCGKKHYIRTFQVL